MFDRLVLIGLLMISATPTAFARDGSGHSGGGAGIICRDKFAGPTTLTVLDYYEAVRDRVDPKRGWIPYDPSKMSIEQNPTYEHEAALWVHSRKSYAVSAMNQSFGQFLGFNRMREILGEIGSPETWIPQKLTLLPDLHLEYRVPKKCTVVQIAKRENGKFYIDPRYLPMLSEYQTGVLYFHEGVYAVADEAGIKSARTIRKLFKAVFPLLLLQEKPHREQLILHLQQIVADVLQVHYLNWTEYTWLFANTGLLPADRPATDEEIHQKRVLYARLKQWEAIPNLSEYDRYIVTRYLSLCNYDNRYCGS